MGETSSLTRSKAEDCDGKAKRVPALAVGLLSGASLGFELLLLRWLAILYWHHFAHMIISVALLGLGVAGSFLTVSQHLLLRRFTLVFQLAACGFAVSLPLVVVLVGRTGFNPLEVVWDAGQGWRLALIFLFSALPFVFSGFAVGLSLRRFPARIAVLYRADLAGAAFGALATPLMLTAAHPQEVLRWLAVPALAAAVLVAREYGRWGVVMLRMTAPLVAALLVAVWPGDSLAPVMSPYKDLPLAMRTPEVRVIGERVSPAGIAVALQAGKAPFRYAPGLSMLSPAEPPEQTALFIDGHAAGVIDHHDGPRDAAQSAYLAWTTAELPYLLAESGPRVLVLGAGGGTDVLHAQRAGASIIDAVEESGALLQVAEDVRALRDCSASTGIPFADSRVTLVEMQPRSYLAACRRLYDLIQISPFGTAAPYADAAQAMREHYLYTVEGVRLMIRRLSPNGVLAVTMPVDIPPRAPVKLLATMAEAAEAEGIADPGRHIAGVRSWNTVTLVMSGSPLPEERIAAVREFCRLRAFDPVWFPGMDAAEANRFNVLDMAYYYEAAGALLQGDGKAYLSRYPFYVLPATDDRPYFGRFFRWRSFPGWWAGRAAGTAPFLEWSYLMAWMLVAAALVLAVPLVGLPLLPLMRNAAAGQRDPARNTARAAYFTALGLAFLLLEIVFIQKFVLFLGHPVVSMAVVVPSFLAFAGLGSGWSDGFQQHVRNRAARGMRGRPVMVAVICMAVIAVLYGICLPAIFSAAAGWPMPLRIALSAGLIGALALWMGIPFPLGLKRLRGSGRSWIPLAWGINGLASVVSAVGAGLLAMHAGFRIVTVVALLLYLAAAGLERRL